MGHTPGAKRPDAKAPDADELAEAILGQLLKLSDTTSSLVACMTAVAIMRGCYQALALTYSAEVSPQAMHDWVAGALGDHELRTLVH